MIFQHTIKQVLSGEKTQTSRLVKPGEDFYLDYSDAVKVYENTENFPSIVLPQRVAWQNIATVLDAHGRRKWEVGKTYAIQPGRGQKSVGRIRVTALSRQDVRTFTYEDVNREGFATRYEFMRTWCEMHDKTAQHKMSVAYWMIQAQINTAESESIRLRKLLESRPVNLYTAWVIRFELAEVYGSTTR